MPDALVLAFLGQTRQLVGPRQGLVEFSLVDPERDQEAVGADIPRVDLQQLPHPVMRLLAQPVLAEDFGLGQQIVLPPGRRDLRRHDLVGGALELFEIQVRRPGSRRRDRRNLELGLRFELPVDLVSLIGLPLPGESRRRRAGRRDGSGGGDRLDRLQAIEVEVEFDLGLLCAMEPRRLRRRMEHLVGRVDLRRRHVGVVELEHEVDVAIVGGRLQPARRLDGGRRGSARGAREDRPLEQARVELQNVRRRGAALRDIRDLERRGGGSGDLRSRRRAMQAGDPGDLLRLRVSLDGERQQTGRGSDVTGVLQAQHGIGDESDVPGLGLDRLGVDLCRLLDLVVAQHQVGDQPVFGQRLVGELLVVKELGELDVRRGIFRDQNRHLLQHADRGRGVVVLLVVVDQHLVLRPGLGDETLLVVELRQALVNRETGRIELDDLLVDRDRLDEESVVGVAVRDLREEPHGLVDAIDARVQVAEPVQRRGVVRVLGEELSVLLDGGVDLAARNELLRRSDDLRPVDGHQAALAGVGASGASGASGARRGRTERKVRRCNGLGP